MKKTVLAGGCFWGLEELLRSQPGVVDTECGYCGGNAVNPTYKNHEGHAEAVEITYDETRTNFRNLWNFFFQRQNPTTLNRQGNDIGQSYRSTIFYSNADERREAEEFIELVNRSKRWVKPVVTTLEPLGDKYGAAGKFWLAEDYHQDYLQKNPNGYTCHRVYFGSYI